MMGMAHSGPSPIERGRLALAAAAVIAPTLVVHTAPVARAESPSPAPSASHLELWSGGEAFGAAWSVYAGGGWAPFGGVHEDGFRVRVVLGAGAQVSGAVSFGDLLFGYHKQLGAVTVKVFGGVTIAEHYPAEPESMLAGMVLGPKIVGETWWSITDRAWASADLSVALPQMHADVDSADRDRVDYAGRIRLGWRLWPHLSIGLEGGAGGPMASSLQTTWQHSMPRAGGFVRYEWGGGEVSISGGLVGADGADTGFGHAFGTVSVLTRF
jgi:hypothetical protein